MLRCGSQRETPDWVRLDDEVKRAADRGWEIYYHPDGNFDDELPCDRERQIEVGGGVWGDCV